MPHTINVTDCSGSATAPQYSHGGSTFSTAATSHTFTAPGTYDVIQAIEISGVFFFDTQAVVVFPIPVPYFEITNCGGNQVHLNVPDWGYDEYDITWETGVAQNAVTFGTYMHTYGNTSPKNVRVEGIYQPELCGNDTTISITPIPTFEKPNIDTLRVLSDSAILLSVSGQNHVVYQIDMYTNGVLTNTHEVIPQNNTFTDTISGLNTGENTYCFIVKAFNRCSNATETTSDEVCSVVLSGAAQVGFNDVAWNTYDGDNFTQYNLERNQTNLASFTVAQNPYVDSNVLCSQQYAYQLTTTASNVKNSTSISNVIILVGESAKDPQAVSGVYSTYNTNNMLEIRWNGAPKIIPLYYSVNTTQTNDTLLVINTFTRNCYEISYTDSCNNTSLVSEQTCPMVLNYTESGRFTIPLSWNAYQSFNNGISHYLLTVYDGNNQFIEEINTGTALEYIYIPTTDNNQIYHFQVTGVSNDSITTLSNRIQVVMNNRMIIPNAFTPNGDGNNDIFLPKTRFVAQFQMSIYNKWGEQLFTTTDINQGWRGEGVPPGVYSYLITVTDFQGETLTEKGTVTLMQ